MPTEEGGNQIQVRGSTRAVYGRQTFQLVVDGQSVAALALDGRGAVRQQAIQPLPPRFQQLVLARRSGGPHRRQDATAGVRDLLIRGASEAHLKLLSTGTREDQVRVRIHKSRED